MQRKSYILFLSFLVSIGCKGQRQGVVLDIDTHLPIRYVQIYTNTNRRLDTDAFGRYFLPTSVTSITLTHGNYLRRTLSLLELKDTVYMLPKQVRMDEVIVYGNQLKPTVTPKEIATYAKQFAPTSAGVGFDFFALFKRNKVSRKERARRRKAIETY